MRTSLWSSQEKSNDALMRGVSKVFEWLNWLAILGAIAYWHHKSPSGASWLLFVGCYLLLLMYFFGFFMNLLFSHHMKFRWIASELWRGVLAICLAAIAAFYMGKLALMAVKVFAQAS